MSKIVCVDDQAEVRRLLADVFRARVVDSSLESFVFEVTGSTEKVNAFINLMKELGIVEIARTGVAAMSRGAKGM